METVGGGGFMKRAEGRERCGVVGTGGPRVASRCWVVGSVASQGPRRPGSPCCSCCFLGEQGKNVCSRFFWRFPFLFFSLFFIFEQFSLFLSSVLFRLRTGVRVLSPPLWVRRVPPLSRSHGRGRLLVYCSVGTPCLGPPDSESCRRRGFPARCVRCKREPRGRDL
jgi:hypothetical protein